MSAIGPAPLPLPIRARRTLLSSCAVASALVVLGHVAPVRAADGYNGTISGSVNYSGNTAANQAQINLTNTNSVLTWTPTDRAATGGSINFQDAGGVTTFVGPRGATDYVVLNRILPSDIRGNAVDRSITFNGTTNGVLFDGATRGGAIWFYSPGGIIVSPTARFDVGSLLLSTNAIAFESGYGVVNPLNRNNIQFAGTVGSAATIDVQAGANATRGLFASGRGANYVALVAPHVIQNGNVTASQTAYVAAEAGSLTTDINVNSGLFSIGVTAGTSVADALTQGGVTALTGSDGVQSRAFMVAVPKNTAITLLVGGSVTYANQASVQDGAVILSTGGVGTDLQPLTVNATPGAGAADITITGSNFTTINAAAKSNVTLRPTTGTIVTGDVNLFGGTGANITVNNSLAVNRIGRSTVGGNLAVLVNVPALQAGGTPIDRLLLNATDATLRIAGNMSLTGQIGTETGANIKASLTRSLLAVGGNLDITSKSVRTDAGGFPGDIAITMTDSSLDVGAAGSGAGTLTINADAVAGAGSLAPLNAFGSFVTLTANGKLDAATPTIRVGGATTISANSVAGRPAPQFGGSTALAGFITVNLGTTEETGGGSFVSNNGGLTLSANASGGDVSSGGRAALNLTGASLTLGGGTSGAPSNLTLSATGTGVAGVSAFAQAGGNGGAGNGGAASLSVDLDTATQTLGSVSIGQLNINTVGVGGSGGASTASSGYGPFVGGAGGTGIGGSAQLNLSAGTHTITGGVTVNANGTGGAGGASGSGAGGNGGLGFGGDESHILYSDFPVGGALVSLSSGADLTTPAVAVSANGAGGSGGTGVIAASAAVSGGSGQGGGAALSLSSGARLESTGNSVAIGATGRGGDAPNIGASVGIGGTGLGGGHGTAPGGAAATVTGSSALVTNSLMLDSSATGGAANLTGGDALGGLSSLTISNGATVPAAIALTINAAATSGTTFSGFQSDGGVIASSGAATGGEATLTLSNVGTATTPFTLTNAINLNATGTGAIGGGDASLFAIGGAGTGGVTNLTVDSGANVAFGGAVTLRSDGIGGDGYTADGGTGTGGSSSVNIVGATATMPSLLMNASGYGGQAFIGTSPAGNQNGGAGIGGLARLLVQSSEGSPAPSLTVAGATTLNVQGTGGSPSDNSEGGYGALTIASGGAGTGGRGGPLVGGAFVDIEAGEASVGLLSLLAQGTAGSSLPGSATSAGSGGTAAITVGTSTVPGGSLTTSGIMVAASGYGVDMSSGYGSGVGGGAGVGGAASLTIYGGSVTNSGSASFIAEGNGSGGQEQASGSSIAAGPGGAASGGTAAVTVNNGTFSNADLTVSASAAGGRGGNGQASQSGTGGAATGGGATVTVGGASGAIMLSGNLLVAADATGGDGGNGFDEESGAAGGAAQGGASAILASGGGTIGVIADTIGTITGNVSALAQGGRGGGGNYTGNSATPLGGAGGDAVGGTASMTSAAGSRISLGNLGFDVSASGGYGAPSVLGGNAVGGSATLLADGGAIVATDGAAEPALASITINAAARGGQGGGSAAGGTVSTTTAGTGSLGGDDMLVDIGAAGTDGVDGHFGTAGAAGGSATAGRFTLDTGAGTVGALTINALATAGNGGNAVEAGYGAAGGAGGDVTGATISLTARGGATINLAALNLGGGLIAGNGGNGSSGSNGTQGADGVDGTQPLTPNGTAGQKGGIGQTGGAGGRGGNATGTALTLLGSGGTLTLLAGEGTSSLDLTATAGSGGAGAAGGDGGPGGTGGTGAAAGTDGNGNPLPAGTNGADGAQGDAGLGGTGGVGGTARGGTLIAAAENTDGLVDLGGLSVDIGATGGNGGDGGGASSGGQPVPINFGTDGVGGDAFGGLVSLKTGENRGAGRIVGGALSVTSTSIEGQSNSGFGSRYMGRFELNGGSNYLSDDRVPVGSISLGSLNVAIAGDSEFNSCFCAATAPVDIVAGNGRISIAGDATISASGDIYTRLNDGSQINVGGLLSLSSGDAIYLSQSGGGGEVVNAATANTVNFFANYVYAEAPVVATRIGDAAGTISMAGRYYLKADDLTATNAITLRGGSAFDHSVPTVLLGNIRTTAPIANPDTTDLSQAGGGTIDVVAGADFNTSLLPDVSLDDANIEITGTVAASNAVRLTAGGDVRLRGDTGGLIQSDNLVRIDAGDNAVIESGASVRAALNPLSDPAGGTGPQDLDTAAGLYITAGLQQATGLVPGEVALVSIAGTVTSGVVDGNGILSADRNLRRGILLSGQAVQTEGGTIGGRTLSVDINGAPAPGSDRSDDSGSLTNGCLQGDACIGALDLTDALTIGGLSGTATLPTTVRVGGGVSTLRTVIRAQGDITLGQGEGAEQFGGSDLLRLQSTSGAVNLLGNTRVQGGAGSDSVFQILAANGISGAGADVASDGTIGLYSGNGGIALANLSAASIDSLDADGNTTASGSLRLDGAFTINDTLSVTGGSIDVTSGGALFVNSAKVSDGYSVFLASTGGDATLNGISGDTTVKPFDISVSSNTGAATLNNASAVRDISVTAATVASADQISAGDDITIGGATVQLGFASTDGSYVESGYGADGSNIAVTASGAIDATGTLDAFETLNIMSSGGPVTANVLTAGDDAIVSGAQLNLASVTSRGTSLEAGYGATPDGSNIRLTATGADVLATPALIVTNADAFQDLTIDATDEGGSIDAGTLTAGRDIAVTAIAAANVTSGDAGGNLLLASSGSSSTGGTLNAGGDLTQTAATDATLTSGTAGRDLNLSAGNHVEAGTLGAGDDIFVSGETVRIGSATTTGQFLESGYGADGSNISISASGAIDITGTADAYDDLTVASTVDRITANVLTAGDDVVVAGNQLNLASVTSRGTSLEAGYGATPDGSNIRLTATGTDTPDLPALVVTTANAAQDLIVQATNAAGSIDATSLVAGRDVRATAGGAIIADGGNAGRDLSLTSTNGAIGSASLTAGRNLGVAARGDVTLGDAIANGPVLLSTDPTNPVPTSGLVMIAAGRSGTTGPYGNANLTLNGTVRAAGHVLATAGGDIVVGPTAQVRSDNRITLNAGDDILIRNGATVSAALAPLPATVATGSTGGTTIVSPAALVLNAGSLALSYTPAAGNVASLIVDSSLSAAARPVSLTAGAIQADGSALMAGSLAINVGNAPAAGAAQSNDNGQLRLGCLQGDVCLGAVTLTGFTAGTVQVPGALSIGQTNAPTNVRIAGAVNVASMAVRALDSITLGSATATTPITQAAAGPVSLSAAAGSVNLLGNFVLNGGAATGTSFSGRTVSIDAGTDVNGAGASIVARGPLTIGVGGSVALASTSSGEATRIDAESGAIAVNSLTTTAIENSGDGPGSGVFLTAAGDVSGLGANAANVDAVGDIVIRAGGDVRLGTAITRTGTGSADLDGSDIDIAATGAVALANGVASDDAIIAAGSGLTIGTLVANGETDNDAGDTAGGVIRLTGADIAATALRSTTSIDAQATNLLRVDDARSGRISFSADGADVLPSAGAPDGTLAIQLGTVDAADQLTIDATTGGIGFASLAAPSISLTSNTRIAGGDATARAGDVSVQAVSDVALGTVTATGDIAASAGGAFTATSLASAVDNPSTSYQRIGVTAGTTIDIGTARAAHGDLQLDAADALTLGDGSAGQSVVLRSAGGGISTGALVAGTFPQGSDDAQFAGDISADAVGDINLASANATGNVLLTSQAGDIATGDITSGANALLFALNDVSVGAVQATDRFYVAGVATAAALDGEFDLEGLDAATPTALNGSATLGGPVAAGSVTVAAAQGIRFGTIDSVADTRLSAPAGAITGDTIRAGSVILLAAADAVRVTTDIAAGGMITASGSDIALNALGDLRLGTIEATDGNLALTSSGGAVTVDRATATQDVLLASGSGVDGTPDTARSVTASTVQAGGNFTVTALGAIDVDNATAAGSIQFSGASALTLGTGNAGVDTVLLGRDAVGVTTSTSGRDFTVATGGDVALGTIDAGGLLSASTTGGALTAQHLNAGGDINLSSLGNLSFGAATSTNGDISATSGDDIAFDQATAGGSVLLSAAGGLSPIDNGSIMAGDSISVTTGRDLTLAALSAVNNLTLNSGGALGIGDATANAGALSLTAANALTVSGTARAGTIASFTAGGDLQLANVTAGNSITAGSTGGALIANTLNAGSDITLSSLGNLSFGAATSTNGDISATSGGDIAFDQATAGGSVLLSAAGGLSPIDNGSIMAGDSISVTTGRDLTLAALSAVNNLTLNSGGALGIGDATANAGALTLTAANALTVSGAARAGTAASFTAGGDLQLANVTAGNSITAGSTGGALIANTLNAGSDINLSSLGNLSFGNATSTNGDISATSGDDIAFDQATAGGSVLLSAGGGLSPIDGGSIMAGDSISVTTGRDLTLAALSAVNNLTLNSGGALGIGDATANAGALTLTAANALTVSGAARAGTTAGFTAGGDLRLASVTAGNTITAGSTGGALIATTLRAGDDITLSSSGDLTLGDAATTRGSIALTGDAVRVTSASAAGSFSASATNTIDIAAPLLVAGRGIMLDADGALTTGGLRATNGILATAGGAIRMGDVESVGGTVRTTGGDSIAIGNVRAAGSIFLTAAAAIVAGDLTAGTGPILPGEGAMTGIGGGVVGSTDAAPAGIAPGFDGASIVRCDDCFTEDPVNLPFLVNYFGNTYEATYVSNNGYLTFNGGQGEYTPTGLGSGYRGQPIIAAFFADVDTRNPASAQTTYGAGTFAGRQAFGATYQNVGYFSNQADKTNSFQIILTNRGDTGAGNFDIYYNYTNISWETGSASGGTNGFGGVSAAVGYNAGIGNQPGTFFELPGSRVPGSFLNGGPSQLITTTNNGTPGQLVFQVRSGTIAPGGAAERPTVHVSNNGGTTPADIRLGNLSGEAVEVHGSGAVTVGDVDVGDRGSGIAATGQPYATVLDAATNLTTGNIMSTGLVALGAREGDLLGGSLTTASSAAVLVGGAVELGAVTTGTGAGDSLFVSSPAILSGDGGIAGFGFDTLLSSAAFDPTVLASLTPVRTGGALTIAGPVSTGNLIAAAGGTTTLQAVDASNGIRVDSGGNLRVTTLTAGGDITATTDGDLAFTGADAGASVTLVAGGALSPIDNGSITAGDSISATTGQDLTVANLVATNNLTLNSGGSLIVGNGAANNGTLTLTAARALTVNGNAVAGEDAVLTAGGAITSGAIRAGNSLSATSGQDLTATNLVATNDLTLNSGGSLELGSGTANNGTLTLTAARALTVSGDAVAGAAALFTAGGAITSGAVTAGDTIAISSTGGSVTATDLLAANGITVRALGNLFVRDAVVNAANGNVTLAGGFPFAATTDGAPFLLSGNTTVSGTVSAGSVTIQGGGDVTITGTGRIRSDGTIEIASGDDIVADSGSVIGLGQITRTIAGGQAPDRAGGPSDVVRLRAGSLRGGTANLAANGPAGIVMNGTVDGVALALNSEAVDIGATGRVGSASTSSAVFTNSGTGGTIVGGAGSTSGYALANASLGRVQAQALQLIAPADVTVQTLGLTGSAATNGNLTGNNALFSIATPGSVSVEGAVTISSAAQTDLFAITAGNRITVLTPSGSIALNGTGGGLGGGIRLAAPRIAVGTQATLAALDGLGSLDARDERLADNDGAISDAGFLQANALRFEVRDGLYIQNSGVSRVSDTRRGFTAGSAGVTIVTTGTNAAEIAINGRQQSTDGTFVTGKMLIDRLTLSGTGQARMASFDPRSTVNGCLIVGMTCRFDGTAPSQPIQDVINAIINGQDDITGAISSVVQQLNSPLIELIDFTPFRLAGIIDEPVTGAGNDDFYTSFVGDDADISANVTVGEQVTGTGRDQAGKEEPDGQCDPKRRDVDPDCK